MINTSILNARKVPIRLLLVLAGSLLLLSGCGKDSDDGDVVNSVALPTDDSIPFNFYCSNEGLFGNTCVLDDPANPYARSPISEESKFELSAEAPSETARFYLWATALAKGIGAPGENQFYTAQALHRMWASSNSDNTRQQALRAYQSYADNYRGSATFFEIPLDSDEFFPFSLDQFAGEMLFDPTNAANLSGTAPPLFSNNPVTNVGLANQEIGDWGYLYIINITVAGTVNGNFAPF
jgi:hypothetical protein